MAEINKNFDMKNCIFHLVLNRKAGPEEDRDSWYL
jgi:hypothetical protein